MQDATRTHKITVRVTQEEFQAIRQQAYQRKLDMGSFVDHKWIRPQLPKSVRTIAD